MNSSKSPDYTQPTNSGNGVDLYNLTGNSPLDPMSTRNKELFKRKKEMDKTQLALETIKKARSSIVKLAADWDKLLNDPKFVERMKKKMEQTKEEKQSKPESGLGFKPKKRREDMSFDEIAEEEEKQVKRDMEKAKTQQGKLHLSEEKAAIIKRMVDFILAAPIESTSYEKQKQIVKSILSGYRTRESSAPGWRRELRDGTVVYVLTGPQLSLISAIYQNAKDELQKEKPEKKEKPFGKIKTEGPTTDQKMNRWKDLMKKKEETTQKEEDVLDLDE